MAFTRNSDITNNCLKILAWLILLVVCQSLTETAVTKLQFHREAINGGEWWRLLSGHMVHLSWSHLLLNGVALAMLPLLFDGRHGKHYLLMPPIIAAVVGMGLWNYSIEVDWYRGFSGVTSGLFVGLAVIYWRQQPWVASLVIALLATKVALEQAGGEAITQSQFGDIPVAVDAHLYGVLGGGLYGVMTLLIRAITHKQTN